MNQNDRLRENRREYRNKFLLGCFGGSGLISALILGVYNFFNRNQSNPLGDSRDKEQKSPEQFEIIRKPSEKE
ncbi:MAG TPA: hypothetical protein VK048_07435 [Atopostipes sp.]|nr:hypothetical protein [Atopostipes sp.]